ncbi:MAG: TlyA family rRNA (cytidine-2'-O)-methyltransferase [Deltaproteobacteria bacterium]|nr:TlyA family rRNA (cytidine-2'-O)-methyltransferase [Deltaproteobacteria bacterium]
MSSKVRLDKLLVDRGLADTRQRAQAIIRAGQVLVNDQPKDKPGTQVQDDVDVRIRGKTMPYVSRGGIKLAAALDAFDVNPEGRVCADLGASTGGFTDCLLQRGASRVFAVDVGYGQLAWKLRQDDRVVVMERTNARHLEALPEQANLIVGDLSFISLKKILPAIQRLSGTGADAVLLIKPQFEVGKESIGKGGVVRDDGLRTQAIDGVREAAEEAGAICHGVIDSPIAGAKKGNIEALIHLYLTAS